MRLASLAIVLVAAAGPAWAAEEAKALQLQPKVAIAPLATPNAPFVMPMGGPQLSFTPEARREEPRSACTAERSLCYDADEGHIVYKAARQFMPSIPGLQPDDISVRRDRIVFRYTF